MRSSVQLAANALVGLIISHSALAAPILDGGISRRADIIAPHPLVLLSPDVADPAVPVAPDPNTADPTVPVAPDPTTTGPTVPVAPDPNTADPTVPVAPDPNTTGPTVPVAPDPNTADPSLTAPAIKLISRSDGAPSTAGGISRRFRPFSFEVAAPDPANVPDLSETTFVPGPGGLSRRFRPFSFEVAAPNPADVPDLSDTTFVRAVTFDPEFDAPPAPVDSDTASAP